MKKITILSSAHPALDVRIFHKQAVSLAKAGYDVTIIAKHKKDEIVDNVKIIALKEPKNRIKRILGTVPKLTFLAFRHKSQAYHFHDPEILPIGFLFKLFTKASIIYDIHEDYQASIKAKNWLPKPIRTLVINIYSIFEKIGLLCFDSIIVAGEDIYAHFPDNPKVSLIRNYPLIDKTTNIGKKSISDKPLAIYIGGMESIRGIKEIVQAVKILNGKVELILLGSFSDANFEKEIRELANESIHILGKVPYSEVFKYMDMASIGLVCLLPSPNNINAASRNNKLFEYMVSELPVISSNFPSWEEIIKNNNCGICVNPENPEEIANAIRYLIERPELIKEMGQNGKKAILEKYNWEKESENLLKIYSKIIDKK